VKIKSILSQPDSHCHFRVKFSTKIVTSWEIESGVCVCVGGMGGSGREVADRDLERGGL
jgi:hypothetical protein